MERPTEPGAAASLLALPLRWADDDDGQPLAAARARGFLRGAAESGRLLSAAVGTEPSTASAFGGPWPLFVVGAHWLAPALPSAVPLGSSEGVDAVYRRDEIRVWREGGGAPCLLLTREATAPAPGAPFDLLWFGNSERYLLHHGRLVVEDVFSELRLSPNRSIMEHELVRVRRADPAILEGLDLGEAAAAAEMTVRRPRVLSSDGRWRDPAGFLACRVDITSVVAGNGMLTATSARSGAVVFAVDEQADGWRLLVVDGEYPYSALELCADGDFLRLRATLATAVDPMIQGARARLAFDLRSDLVTLG